MSASLKYANAVNTVRAWFEQNLVKVQIVNYQASNYILSDTIIEETGCKEVNPMIVHMVAQMLGYVPTHRHGSCYSYNAKFRSVPLEETLLIENYNELPTRHAPVLMFAQLGKSGPFYIQVTTNVRGRMEDLSRMNPYNIYLVGIMRTGWQDAGNILDAFEPHLIKSGWYESVPEIKKFIYQSGQVENKI